MLLVHGELLAGPVARRTGFAEGCDLQECMGCRTDIIMATQAGRRVGRDGAEELAWRHCRQHAAGRNLIALEVFPGVLDLTDEANLSHLWVLPEDFVLPFTL